MWPGFLDPFFFLFFFFFCLLFLALDMHFMGAILRCSVASSITTFTTNAWFLLQPPQDKSDRDECLSAQLALATA